MRALLPRRGGRTVGDQSSRIALENCQSSQIWSIPPGRAGVGWRNSGSNTTVALRGVHQAALAGMPNLEGKSLWMRAIIFIGTVSGIKTPHNMIF